MTRNLILTTLVLGVLSTLTVQGMAQNAAGARRPNLLFILSDDQRYDAMGCAGNRIVRTPEMDALAREGVRFRNAFVTTPICAASRASLFTGLYERTHRYTFNTAPIQDRHLDTSYPVQLRKAGYRTGFIGKFGVEVEKGGQARMFDYYRPLNRTPYFKKQPDGTERWVEDIAGDRAVEFLEGCRPGQPFCLQVSFNAPHAEDNDPKQYFWPHSVDGLYRDVAIPVPKTMTEAFFRKQQPFLQNSESRVRFNWRFDEPAKYQEMVKGYYRMIAGIDLVIGRIRDELKQRGLADNTVIVFSSDNGYFLGERGFADKWYGYEYSLRVPLIIYDPRLENSRRGRVVGADALNVDIPPTLLDLAGAPVPGALQGRSLAPWLRGRKPKHWRTGFFFEHLFERSNIPKSEGVRDRRFTYIRWFEKNAEELYDHRADFDEIRDLSTDPGYRSELERLRRRTDELRDLYGGPYRPNPRTHTAIPGAAASLRSAFICVRRRIGG